MPIIIATGGRNDLAYGNTIRECSDNYAQSHPGIDPRQLQQLLQDRLFTSADTPISGIKRITIPSPLLEPLVETAITSQCPSHLRNASSNAPSKQELPPQLDDKHTRSSETDPKTNEIDTNTDSQVAQSIQLFSRHNGSTVAQVLTKPSTPGHGGEWHIPNPIDPSRDLSPIVVTNITGPDGNPQAKSGSAIPQIVQWPGGEGLTLLIDIAHIGNHEFLHPEWCELDIGLVSEQGELVPIRNLQWPKVAVTHPTPSGSRFCIPQASRKTEQPGLQPLERRIQIAINLSKRALQSQFPNIHNGFHLGVQSHFSRPNQRHFHNQRRPYMAKLPPIFEQGTPAKPVEFRQIPINLSIPVTPALADEFPKLIDSTSRIYSTIETEIEYTLETRKPEANLLELVTRIDKFVGLPGSSGQRKLSKLLKGIGNGNWHLERKLGKDVIDARHNLTDRAKQQSPSTIAHYGIAPARPELQEIGLGQPGIMRDTYLFIGPEGVIRQRDNFLEEGLLCVKGAYRRDKDGIAMSRYCRQISTKSHPAVNKHSGKIANDTNLLLYNDAVNFQDALYQYQDGVDPHQYPTIRPQLRKSLVIDSERYRYVFVHKDPKTGSQPTLIELSFDISKGQIGNRQVKVCGFEFGLDHLGVSASMAQPTNSPHSPAIVIKPHSHASSLIRAVAPRLHNRSDLASETLMHGHAYRLFSELEKAVTQAICKDKHIRISGNKAKNMLELLSSAN